MLIDGTRYDVIFAGANTAETELTVLVRDCSRDSTAMSGKKLGSNQLDPLSLRRLSGVLIYGASFDNRLGNRRLRRVSLNLSLIILCCGVLREHKENEKREEKIPERNFVERWPPHMLSNGYRH